MGCSKTGKSARSLCASSFVGVVTAMRQSYPRRIAQLPASFAAPAYAALAALLPIALVLRRRDR
jgi:hypothetical protein